MLRTLRDKGVCPFCASTPELHIYQYQHSAIVRALRRLCVTGLCCLLCYGALLLYPHVLRSVARLDINTSLMVFFLVCFCGAVLAKSYRVLFSPSWLQCCVFQDREGRIHIERTQPRILSEMSGRMPDLRPVGAFVVVRIGIGTRNGRVYANGKDSRDRRFIRLDSVQPLSFSYRTPTIRLTALGGEALLGLIATEPHTVNTLASNAQCARADASHAPGDTGSPAADQCSTEGVSPQEEVDVSHGIS